ncbi:hypothetical protein [Enterococcus saccharolyticus]|uniref:hypothetical protein n=1 Tax=Enterococcus saccharolyticus TaxID=41997 RepID=UPI0039E00705
MKKINHLLQLGSILLMIGAIILFVMASKSVKQVGAPNFDLTRWEDVDLFILKLGFNCLIGSFVLSVSSFFFSVKWLNKKENK